MKYKRNIEGVKDALGIDEEFIAKAFSYKNSHSFITAHRRDRVEKGIIEIYNRTIKSIKKK